MRVFLCTTFAFVFSAACAATPVGVNEAAIPPSSGQTCANQCSIVGMTLDSIVIMAGRLGCVCRAAPSNTPPTAAPGATVGALSAIIDDEEAAARRRRNSSSPRKH